MVCGQTTAGQWMRCFKLPGERVMSRDFDRQVAALQIRAAILNRFTALGTPITQRAGQGCQGKRPLRPSEDLRNQAPGEASGWSNLQLMLI